MFILLPLATKQNYSKQLEKFYSINYRGSQILEEILQPWSSFEINLCLFVNISVKTGLPNCCLAEQVL